MGKKEKRGKKTEGFQQQKFNGRREIYFLGGHDIYPFKQNYSPSSVHRVFKLDLW